MDTFKNKAAFISFIIILLLFLVGGFFFMDYFINLSDNPKETESPLINESVDYRLDKTKDYIYLSETDIVIAHYGISFAKVNINLSSAKDIETRINNEVAAFSETVVMADTVEIPEGTETLPNTEGIYSVSYKDYEIIEYSDYVTLIDKNYNYDIVNLITATGVETNIFSKASGSVVSEIQILEDSGKTLEDIKNAVRTKLTTLNLDGAGIDVDGTINDFDYGVYLNRIGKLEVIYLVRSTNQNYYDTLVIN